MPDVGALGAAGLLETIGHYNLLYYELKTDGQ